MLEPAPDGAADPDTGAKALRDQSASDPVSDPSIPRGCTREWSASDRDSVLYCPDIRPPKPR